MVMYVTPITKDGPSETGQQWHIGNPFNLAHDNHLEVEVQADGDELEFVLRNFKGLPHHEGRTVIWNGDFARFIAVNLGSVAVRGK